MRWQGGAALLTFLAAVLVAGNSWGAFRPSAESGAPRQLRVVRFDEDPGAPPQDVTSSSSSLFAPEDSAPPGLPPAAVPVPPDAVDVDPRPFLAPIGRTAEDVEIERAHRAAAAVSPAHYFRFVADSPLPLPGWKPGRARPIVCDGMEYYSGHFSIPSENIIAAVPRKTRDWATVVPGRKATYVFKREEDYRADLEASRFAITRRRYGFATNRNLEILAAGSVPYFCGVATVPRIGTLASLPMDFLRLVVSFPGVAARCFPHKRSQGFDIDPAKFNESLYMAVAAKLLGYTRAYQTTSHFALYALSATSVPALPRHVLVLWASHYTIMLTGLIHGLRSLGVTVEDVPRRPEVYRGEGCAEAKAKTYAKGWFFFCKTDESPGLLRTNISARIRAREFDVIIISITDTLTYYMKDPRRDVPYFDDIVASYPRDRVLTMNDADLIKQMQADVAHKMMHNMSKYFKRETHGCRERIW